MQQLTKRFLSSLVVSGLTLAALTAPPSVFAETAPTPTPTPAPAPAPTAPAVPAAPAGAIRIGLAWGEATAEVSAPGGMLLVSGGAVAAQIPAGQSVKVTLTAGKLAVAGQANPFDAVRLVPVAAPPAPTPVPAPDPNIPPAKPANPLTFKNRQYRGEIELVIAPVSKKLSVVNVLNYDEYLLGVVPEEVEATWPIEAVKAQAVAARTYALSNLGKWKGEGFDLVWTTSDQYYGGLTSEKPQSNQAVYGTRGQVLTFNGRLISAMYHSSSGGYTENNEIIYPSQPVGYLRGVPDYDNVPGNRYYNWQYTYSLEQISNTLKNRGFDVGALAAISSAGLVGVSGRPAQWQVSGAAGTKTLTGKQVRDALDLPSNPKLVTIQPGGMSPAVKSYTEASTFFAVSAGNVVQQRPANGSAVLAAGKATALVASAVTAMGAKMNQPAGVMVSGGGYGHAVGMSQWGANGMARQGKTYQEILTHYYSGTRLETR